MSIDDFNKSCKKQNIKDGDPVAIYYQDFAPIECRIFLPLINVGDQWYIKYLKNSVDQVLLVDVKAIRKF